MASVKNISEQGITIAGQRLDAGGEIEVSGKIPRSLRRLAELGALEITGAEPDEDDENQFRVLDVNNPEVKQEVDTTPTADEKDLQILEVMKSLPDDAMMGDGRPEVRRVNEKLAEAKIPNITAEERDRIWALTKDE